jgi:hypothetical protein
MPKQTIICTCDISIPIPAISASFTLEPKDYVLATYERSSTTRANARGPNEIAADDRPLSVSKIRFHPHQSGYNLVRAERVDFFNVPPDARHPRRGATGKPDQYRQRGAAGRD